MAVKQIYKYECDRCGAVYTTDEKKMPIDWSVLSLKTMCTYDGITTEFDLCDDCTIAFLNAMNDFLCDDDDYKGGA